jgi:hypothetical protein
MGRRKKTTALAVTEQETQFAAGGVNQPPAELKKLGWANKKILRNILEAKLPASQDENVISLANSFGLKPEELTISMAMHFKMIHKVLQEGNVSAYTKLMERAYGMPKQTSESANYVEVRIITGEKPIDITSKQV